MFSALDRRIAKWAANNVGPAEVPIVRSVTHLGGTEVAVTAGVVAGLVGLRRTGSWHLPLRLLVIVGGQNLLHNLIKRFTRRRRPAGPHYSHFSGTSFPSGHTTTAAAAWPAIVDAALPTAGAATRAVSYAAGPAVGATRVLLGVHWLSDVAAGLALGWGWLAVSRRATRRWAR